MIRAFLISSITGIGILWIFVAILMSCQAKHENPSQVAPTSPEKDKITSPADEPMNNTAKKNILFFGNSLTAGYGLDEQEAFPALIQRRIDSLGLQYNVINAGLSGETSSGGDNRIDWVLNQTPDIFVLELGANDMLRGLDLKETEKHLSSILQKVKAKNPQARMIIAGMMAPPNMGKEYTGKFAALYPALAKKYNAQLIPFFLEGVAAKPELNLPDGKHPNAEGQKIVMENVWKVLGPLLQ
jgi:acyl-CoA thioesterase-1